MIIGIDLGTTNSAVAIWRDGAATLIPNRLGDTLTPSAVSIGDDGSLIVGRAARDRQVTHPAQSATAFKRYMGTEKMFDLGRRRLRPEELSALVLGSLKEDAEAWLGEAVTEAVITVPAYFNDRQRKATRRAGELAGLKVERLINEPTAAALAYGIHQLDDESRFLVFDLGGGTFDVSVLEIFEGVIEVRSSTGDNRLGGEDFNELIVTMLRERLGEAIGSDARHSDALYQKLRDQAERVRRALGTAETARAELVWKEVAHSAEIDAAAFEDAAQPLIQRLREPVLRSLRDSAVRADQLSEIILIGGATRMPVVRRAVTRMFSRFPNSSINPDEAVALGAAVQAGLKARDAALGEVVLTDVCPYSLGVSIGERRPDGSIETGIFAPIIERNTVIPASRMNWFSTMENNQRVVELGIYQGESRKVADNVALGSVSIPVARGPAGQQVECRFSYDINGLLEVDVHVPATGETRQLVIDDGTEGDAGDIARRRAALADLKQHPRDSEAVRVATARADRAWENALGPVRDHIGGLIAGFAAVVNGQDPRAVAQAIVELTAALDQIEGQDFL
jgi:molecular chaperone HscC